MASIKTTKHRSWLQKQSRRKLTYKGAKDRGGIGWTSVDLHREAQARGITEANLGTLYKYARGVEPRPIIRGFYEGKFPGIEFGK